MTAMSINAKHSDPAVTAALVVAAVGIATILGAYVFQYGFGVAPCPLCLDQRKVYYVAIPLAVVVALIARTAAPRPLVVGGLALVLVAMLIGTGIAIYHSGVEWKFWPGPQDCSGPIDSFGNAGSLLDQMTKSSVVRCDQPQRFLGVSLANCNVVISLALVVVTVWGLRARLARL
jgi:disulfide bond formation protein DsbB